MRAVLRAEGAGEFLTLGWSGGGPRALAAAALLPHRCRAAATLAGVAPIDAPGLDWNAGMGPENVEDTNAARQGPEVYQDLLTRTMPPVFAATAKDIVASFGELLTPVDAAALTGEIAEHTAASTRHAGAQGVVGARDDGLALLATWGFDVADSSVPVAVWQGRQAG